jgi:hypothetical protein
VQGRPVQRLEAWGYWAMADWLMAQANASSPRFALTDLRMLGFLEGVARVNAQDALARLRHLRTYGSGPRAFSVLRRYEPTGAPVRRPAP